MTHPPVWNALSFDVEDWYHIMEIPGAPRLAEWGGLENRVDRNTHRILELLKAHRTTATFFFLGWVAEKNPDLVRSVMGGGHEVASHGYAHDIVYEIGPDRFRADLAHAVGILEGLTGRRPQGYRAPGFSITAETPWAFDIISELGFRYDSSVFPATRLHGGFLAGGKRPHKLRLNEGRELHEFPISTVELFGRRIAFSGGGYLRLFPLPLILRWVRRLNAQGVPVVVYLHPREFDPDHPRLPMTLGRRFRSYVGLRTVETKLKALLNEFHFTTVAKALDAWGGRMETPAWQPREGHIKRRDSP